MATTDKEGASSSEQIPEKPLELANDRDFWKVYERGETIGRGHFAKVKLVRHRATQGFYAAKLLDKELEEHMEDYQAMMREFQVLRKLHHINIVKLFEAYESPKTLILVTELATGGELMHRIVEEMDVYSEAEVKKHIHTILGAVGFMHEAGVVHRDLKPENILLSDKSDKAHILIADFGLGRFVTSPMQLMDTVCGTHHYLAPELVMCDRGTLESYDRSVDVWGVGLIAFIMLFGYNPFLRESNMQTQEAIVQCKFNFPREDNVSSKAKDLLRRMLMQDPRKRITVDQALVHPWLRDAGTNTGALRVGGKEVRSVMKEFNARRAVMALKKNLSETSKAMASRAGAFARRSSETAEDILKNLNLLKSSSSSDERASNNGVRRRRGSSKASDAIQATLASGDVKLAGGSPTMAPVTEKSAAPIPEAPLAEAAETPKPAEAEAPKPAEAEAPKVAEVAVTVTASS